MAGFDPTIHAKSRFWSLIPSAVGPANSGNSKMILRDVMTRDPVCATGDMTLEAAARLMKRANVGFLPVVDGSRDAPSRLPLGVVTDRDLVMRGMAEGRDPAATRIAEVFTRSPVHAYDDTPAREAFDLMQRHIVGRLLVSGRDENLVGVVSMATVAGYSDDTLWDDIRRERTFTSHGHQTGH